LFNSKLFSWGTKGIRGCVVGRRPLKSVSVGAEKRGDDGEEIQLA